MIEPQEFPSPFSPPATPAVAHPKPVVAVSQPNHRLDVVIAALAADSDFFRFIADLAVLPLEERAAELRSIGFWRTYLKGVERAKVVKGHRPELFDREVADLARVARETLGRDGRYMAFKRLLSEAKPATGKWRGRNRHRIEVVEMEDHDWDDG